MIAEYNDLDKLIRGKNINFLIGVGASVPMYPSLSFGPSLPSFEEIASHNAISKQAKILLYIYYFLHWIEPMRISEKEFRDKHSNDKVFLNYQKLVENFYDYLQRESDESSKKVNVFTTNYDLLFERAFDEFLFSNPLIILTMGHEAFLLNMLSKKIII